jgi:flagellar basal-body rod protein FlgB
MDMGQIPLFSLLTQRMQWLSARQALLAQNVANADTPNYIARDMTQVDFGKILANQNSATSISMTNVRHIPVSVRGGGAPYDQEDALGEGGTPTGNVVSLEQEMIKLSDTQIQYQTATNLYQKAVNMFRTALGGRSS